MRKHVVSSPRRAQLRSRSFCRRRHSSSGSNQPRPRRRPHPPRQSPSRPVMSTRKSISSRVGRRWFQRNSTSRNCHHESRDCGRRRRPAARDSDRRQSAGNRQPDRVGDRHAQSVRHRRRAAHHELEQQLHMLFPGEDVTVGTSEGATVLSGRVSNTNVMLRIGEIAQASMPKAQVINLLQVPGGSESQQVMLQVRFAEVNRRIIAEAGLALFVSRQRFLARSTTQQFSAQRSKVGTARIPPQSSSATS